MCQYKDSDRCETTCEDEPELKGAFTYYPQPADTFTLKAIDDPRPFSKRLSHKEIRYARNRKLYKRLKRQVKMFKKNCPTLDLADSVKVWYEISKTYSQIKYQDKIETDAWFLYVKAFHIFNGDYNA